MRDDKRKVRRTGQWGESCQASAKAKVQPCAGDATREPCESGALDQPRVFGRGGEGHFVTSCLQRMCERKERIDVAVARRRAEQHAHGLFVRYL